MNMIEEEKRRSNLLTKKEHDILDKIVDGKEGAYGGIFETVNAIRFYIYSPRIYSDWAISNHIGNLREELKKPIDQDIRSDSMNDALQTIMNKIEGDIESRDIKAAYAKLVVQRDKGSFKYDKDEASIMLNKVIAISENQYRNKTQDPLIEKFLANLIEIAVDNNDMKLLNAAQNFAKDSTNDHIRQTGQCLEDWSKAEKSSESLLQKFLDIFREMLKLPTSKDLASEAKGALMLDTKSTRLMEMQKDIPVKQEEKEFNIGNLKSPSKDISGKEPEVEKGRKQR